jgi:glycerol-3-phosphate dehydrogenase subunit B
LIVGFNQFLDFSPTLIADNLNAQGFLASSITLDLLFMRTRKLVSGMVLARFFDDPDFRDELIDGLKPKIGNFGRIGFPAVLGINNTSEVLDHLESALGIPVFEIPGLPPSVPGIRLHNMLLSAIEKQGGTVNNGILVSGAQAKEQIINAIISEAAARQIRHPARKYILASGGILGGGIITDKTGYAQETIFDLPISPSIHRSDWFNSQFLSHESHPIHTIGLRVNPALQPVNDEYQVIYHNLYAVGNLIGNCDPIRECSLEGIALATGYKIGESINL